MGLRHTSGDFSNIQATSSLKAPCSPLASFCPLHSVLFMILIKAYTTPNLHLLCPPPAWCSEPQKARLLYPHRLHCPAQQRAPEVLLVPTQHLTWVRWREVREGLRLQSRRVSATEQQTYLHPATHFPPSAARLCRWRS